MFQKYYRKIINLFCKEQRSNKSNKNKESSLSCVYKKWIPTNYEPASLYAKSVLRDENGLTIVLHDYEKKKEIIFTFSGIIYSYRFIMESAFFRTPNHLYVHYKKKFCTAKCFFKLEKSEYLEWFKAECYDAYDVDKNFEHYVLFTD